MVYGAEKCIYSVQQPGSSFGEVGQRSRNKTEDYNSAIRVINLSYDLTRNFSHDSPEGHLGSSYGETEA